MQKIIVILITVIIFMVTVWGLLAKSQIDSETIEEMVDRKIAEHEADPEAHMGTDESIDVHRKSDIVDHKAGSVLSDKNTMSEFEYYSDFETLAGFSVVGDTSVTNENSARLYIESGDVELSRIYKEFLRPAPFMTTDKDFLMQALLQFDFGNNNVKVLKGISFGNAGTGDFAGFKIIDNVVKGYVKDGGYSAETSAMSVTLTNANIFRVQYIAGETKIYFYINGQIAGTITRDLTNWNSDGGPLILVEPTDTNDGFLYVKDLRVSRSTI